MVKYQNTDGSITFKKGNSEFKAIYPNYGLKSHTNPQMTKHYEEGYTNRRDSQSGRDYSNKSHATNAAAI